MNILDSLNEEVNAKISAKTKKALKSTEVREKMKSDFGDNSFLDPENKKFPICNPETGKLDCKLVYAAYMRAKIHSSKGGSSLQPASYYSNIADKAKKIYKKNNCEKLVKASIAENASDLETMDLITFTEMFVGKDEFAESKNIFFEFLED